MICNRCGAKNSDTRKKCFHCGYVFPVKDQTELSGVFAVRPSEEKEEPVQEEIAGEREEAFDEPGQELYDRQEEEFDEPEEAVDERPEEEAPKKNRPDEITHLALDHEKRETYYVSSRKKGGAAFTAAIWALAILFVIVLLIAGVLIYQYFSENDNLIEPPTPTSSTSQMTLTQPKIEKINDENGVETVHAVFYGAPGDRLYLGCNDRYYTFVENTLTLDLHLSDLFSSEYVFLEPAVSANLNAYHIRENKRYKYDTPSVTVHVPEAELTLLTVSESSIKVYRDKFTVQLWAQSGAQVFLNNNNITSFMDGTGIVSYDVDVREFSSTTYQVRVTQPYHTPRSATFILMRDALPVSLTLATSNASIISDSTITITGSTEEDAVITANLPLISLEKNEIYNTYNAVIDLSSLPYGRQEVLITATNSKGSSTRSHIFWYWPAEQKITTTANRFDSAVATNANAYARRNYVMNSVTIKRIVGANRFEAVCTLNGVEYPVILTYEYRKLNVQVGATYKVFAACEGAAYDGSAQMRVWYLYKN